MIPARITELLHPFLPGEEISAELLDNISTYIDILLHWNSRISLTAIRDPEEIVTRHFGESFFAARHLFPHRVGTAALARPPEQNEGNNRGRAALVGGVPGMEEKGTSARETAEARSLKSEARLADIGSGAGFPGIPIKIWAPEIRLTLIESNQKKSTFLREIVRSLTLMDIDVHNGRAERYREAHRTQSQHCFDVVALRAVEQFSSILPVASGLLAPSGRLALLIGQSQLSEVVAILPGLAWRPPLPVPLSESRLLLIGERI